VEKMTTIQETARLMEEEAKWFEKVNRAQGVKDDAK
jgi:hypothetical protein